MDRQPCPGTPRTPGPVDVRVLVVDVHAGPAGGRDEETGELGERGGEEVLHASIVFIWPEVSKLSYNSDTMAFDELRNTLIGLGLSGHEPAVYAALLEHSPASAAWIAKQCGLSRSSVYATLGVLTGKGLVGVTHKNDVKQFVAGGATALLETLRTQQREAT